MQAVEGKTAKLKINGFPVEVRKSTTVLEAARFLGIDIPTLCHADGLKPYGVCRLCIVEARKGKRVKMIASCVCAAEAVHGFDIRTHSARVIKARRILIELLLAECPKSKVLQDLAARYGVKKVRVAKEDKLCFLCGLCVRVCEQQMMSGAIGYVNRGNKRRITTPFDIKSDICRTCGACMYICPACQMRCLGPTELKDGVCGSCTTMDPTCQEVFSENACYMGETGSCGTCIKPTSPTERRNSR
jgi:coenzyme F420 hydrogenase subunit beta